MYQRLTEVEHVLHRPDMFVGSTEVQSQPTFVYDIDQKQIVYDTALAYVPAYVHIVDEILVNACDVKARHPTKVKRLDCSWSARDFTVTTHGVGITHVNFDGTSTPTPQVLFGELRSSSNYDDAEERLVGGLNGFGAKLTNIFSSVFQVTTTQKNNQTTCEWQDNMKHIRTNVETKEKKQPLTSVTFVPDMTRFSPFDFEKTKSLLYRRVMDISACHSDWIVSINGVDLDVPTFSSYLNCVSNAKDFVMDEKKKWKVAIQHSDEKRVLSLVNGIHTRENGSHVDHVTNEIRTILSDALKKELKKTNVKFVLNEYTLVVFSTIVNPKFNTQTKDKLVTRKTEFGSLWKPSADFKKNLLTSTLYKHLLDSITSNELRTLDKQIKKQKTISSIPKLYDAPNAGGCKSNECTLILTEGDSAKALAMAGLSALDKVVKKNYGVFALKGKLLNVRDVSKEKLHKNQEITNLRKIIGLELGKKYVSTDMLRYGKVAIMADQDTDGFHITGLVLNFFHTFWPELLEQSFVLRFQTPIVKCTKKNETKTFFNLDSFHEWTSKKNANKNWKVKYYKGLGSSTNAEGKSYFSELKKHLTSFDTLSSVGSDAIQLAFDKKKASERKTWIRASKTDTGDCDTSIEHFVNGDLRAFELYSNKRSIPSVCDGLKTSQRKIIHTVKKHTQETKVAQLAAIVANDTNYHHGELSLCKTIVHLAQEYPTSNNNALLQPIGQFGSRQRNGEDAADARYLYTKPAPILNKLFRAEDDALLDYITEENKQVEPAAYVPIIPFVLVNGSKGIGSGFSSSVLPHNIVSIIENVENMLTNQDLAPLVPFWKGWRGDVTITADGKVITSGKLEANVVTELPVGTSIEKYTEHLTKLQGQKKIKKFCLEYDDVDITIHLEPTETLQKKELRLESTHTTGNMYLWTFGGELRKFTIDEIFKTHFETRWKLYEKRIQTEIKKTKEEYTYQTKKNQCIQNVQKNGVKAIEDQFSTLPIKEFNMLEQNMKKAENLCKKIKKLEKETPKKLWMRELQELKNQVLLEAKPTHANKKRRIL